MTEKPRFTITLDDDTLDQVNDFQENRRFATRSKAIVELVKLGLEELSDSPISTVEVNKKVSPYSSEAAKLARKYDALDKWGKQALRELAATELSRMEDEAHFLENTMDTEPESKVIPLYWSAPAAGIASPILGEDYDAYELRPDDPQGAVFAVKVQGDSMEPDFPDGSTVFCSKDPLADGEIGVFAVDGGSVIKQYHYDKMLGMTYLFSLNRNRADADVLITRSGNQTLTCLGRVITQRRYPIPGRS